MPANTGASQAISRRILQFLPGWSRFYSRRGLETDDKSRLILISPVGKVSKILWSLYTIFFAALAVAATRSDLRLGYPVLRIALFAAASVANLKGLVAYILEVRSAHFRSLWRAVVPISLVLVSASAVLDESQNPTKDAGEFLVILSLFVALLAPAYFANFRFAYTRGG
jgi:hypothetical protein